MIKFNKTKDGFTSKSFSFKIDHKLDELEMESKEYFNNGLSTERHRFRISKDEAKNLSNICQNGCSMKNIIGRKGSLNN